MERRMAAMEARIAAALDNMAAAQEARSKNSGGVASAVITVTLAAFVIWALVRLCMGGRQVEPHLPVMLARQQAALPSTPLLLSAQAPSSFIHSYQVA